MHIALSTVVALVLYFAVLIGIGLITYKKDEDMEGYALGGACSGALGHIHECRSLRYERMDAHGAARLCLYGRHQCLLDCVGTDHRHLGQLDRGGQTAADLHFRHGKRHHPAGILRQSVL